MTWLEERLAQIGKNQAGAARALGLPQQRIREINKGLRRIQQDEWGPLATFLEWTVDELHKASGGMRSTPLAVYDARSATVSPASAVKIEPVAFTDGTIPVFWNKPIGGGVLHIERRVVDVIPRSEYLRYAQYSFAIEIMQDDMSPAFERRDVAVINPDRAVMPGDDVLLVRGYEPKSAVPFDAVLRRLVKDSDTHWTVRQFSPPRDYKLAKSEWTQALHVAGKRSR